MRLSAILMSDYGLLPLFRDPVLQCFRKIKQMFDKEHYVSITYMAGNADINKGEGHSSHPAFI